MVWRQGRRGPFLDKEDLKKIEEVYAQRWVLDAQQSKIVNLLDSR